MAHEIYQDAAGQYSFAWAEGGAVPWHGLGQTVKKNASREAWLKAAGYLWSILQAPVQYEAVLTGKKKPVLAQDSQSFVNYRSDTGAPLGVVSDGYKIVQPQDIFQALWNWAEAGGLKPESAGVLRGGKRFFVLAKNGGTIEIKKGDKTQSYCLLATSADGTLATRAQWTAIRVVCANTLALATGNGKGKAEYKCTHRSVWNPDDAAEALGVKQAREDWDAFAAKLTKLAQVRAPEKEVTQYFSDLLRPPKESGIVLDLPAAREKVPVRAIRGLDELELSYRNAPGAVPGTWYGALQGVTHFVDHARGKDVGRRLDSALFAQGAELKQRAFEVACQHAGA